MTDEEEGVSFMLCSVVKLIAESGFCCLMILILPSKSNSSVFLCAIIYNHIRIPIKIWNCKPGYSDPFAMGDFASLHQSHREVSHTHHVCERSEWN